MSQEEMTKRIEDAINDGCQEIAITIQNVFQPMVDMYEMEFMSKMNERNKK